MQIKVTYQVPQGGILLTLRKRSTIFTVMILDSWSHTIGSLSRLFHTALLNLARTVSITHVALIQ